MKHSRYMDRALRANDQRYVQILSRLGYERRDMVPAEDLGELRAEYLRVVGKRPFHGWDANTLREKIAAAA